MARKADKEKKGKNKRKNKGEKKSREKIKEESDERKKMEVDEKVDVKVNMKTNEKIYEKVRKVRKVSGKIEKRKNKKKKNKKNLGIVAEKDDFSEWFTELITKAELVDYTSVSGCLVFMPYAYMMWEKIVEECDKRLKKFGVKNCYFPLLIPEKLLQKEAEHVESFAPEVAWVTEAGKSKLSERLAIRPTSEVIMYESFAKWIRSWRDLPLKLNQWNSAIRWEFKHPVPFFRTREFLWNELHTVHASEEEAKEEGIAILNMYKEFCEEYLALYGVIGKKTEKEKFAGGVESWKLHYILPSGKIIEGPCYHNVGQNFAKAFNIQFLDKDEKKKYVWQNTYAITTRMLGTMFAIHSDAKGLVIPPKIAPIKVVIIPIFYNQQEKQKVLQKAKEIEELLNSLTLETFVDDREQYTPGYKFNEYELKGIPVRIEIGMRDIEKNQVVLFRRDTLEKEFFAYKNKEELANKIKKMLDEMQRMLFDKSRKLFEEKLEHIYDFEKLNVTIKNKKVAISPLCNKVDCEDEIKNRLAAKVVYINEEIKDKVKAKEKCIVCDSPANYFVCIGKVY